MIKGESINLRIIQQQDLDELLHHSNNVDNAGEFMPNTLYSEIEFNRHFQENGFWHKDFGQLIIESTDGQILGLIGFRRAQHYIDGYEIFYRIFNPKYRGQGLMSQALNLFVRLMFQSKPINRLQAVTAEGNFAAERVLDKCHFVFEGIMREARILKGKHVNLKTYSILKNEVFN